MFTIPQFHSRAMAAYRTSEAEYKDSQLARMRYIASAKECGDNLRAIKEALKGANPYHPIETPIGTFTSFTDYKKQHGWESKRADRYIKLSEGWDIVLKLGMQDADNAEALDNSMRITRTLKIIDWYKAQVKLGRPESELTLDVYWEEQEKLLAQAAAMLERQQTTTTGSTTGEVQPTWKELKQMLKDTQAQLEAKTEEIDKLRSLITDLQRKLRLAQRQPVSV